MDRKKLILVVAHGLLTDELFKKVKEQHPDHDVEHRTPEEHLELSKKERVFEREPLKLTKLEDFDLPYMPELKKGKFEGGGSPIDAISKKRKW